jgi:DNA helicase-2/ATP-dependent DNA helicase PcrA
MLFEVEAWAVTSESRNPSSAREAYDDLVISYLSIPANHSLRGFIEWLIEVEKRDRETPRQEPPEPGTVQVLTIHSAKGLEWDSVAIPNWTETSKGRVTTSANELGWLQPGALPGPFREDQTTKFSITPDIAERMSDKELDAALTDYNERLKKEKYLPEERRVFYVAVTRARHYLWVSGSYFQGENITPKEPNKYWNELVKAGLIDPTVICEKPEARTTKEIETIVWPPADPLGSAENRAAHEAAAEMVRSANGTLAENDLSLIEQLIANNASAPAMIPVRIPASRYAEWSIDLNRVKETSRRPVPERPYRAARIGTEVHAWIERRGYDDGMFDLGLDFDTDSETLSSDRVEELKQKFAKSRWAKFEPVYSEIEILLPQGKHVVVCKIDAVYKIDGRWAVVDWKTGAMPSTENEKDQKAMQLVLYRRAFATWMGIEPSEVDAVLFYVAHETEWLIEPERLSRLEALPPIEG